MATALGLAGPACERPPIEVSEPPVRLVHDVPGRGPEVRPGLVACIAYVVRYPDGRVLMRDAETCLTVGAENVIDGLRQAILGMRAGGRRVAELPPHSHWGRPGHGPIPPNTTLRLEVEVLSVHPPGWRPADASPSPWDVAEAR